MQNRSQLNDLSSTTGRRRPGPAGCDNAAPLDSVVFHGSAAGTQIVRVRQRDISRDQRSSADLSFIPLTAPGRARPAPVSPPRQSLLNGPEAASRLSNRG
jgi:hypothetical protein